MVANAGVDPTVTARALWLARHPLPAATVDVTLRDEALKSDVKIRSAENAETGLVISTGFPSLLRTGDRNGTIQRTSRAVFDGGIGSKSDRAFQIRTIGASLQNIAWLHWQEFSNGRAADSLLDQPNEVDYFTGRLLPTL